MTAVLRASLNRRRLLSGAAASLAGASALVAARGIPSAVAAGEPAPHWETVFAGSLDNAMGYVYAVARDGELVAGRGVGLARSTVERVNPGQPWTLDTLSNLASVSKPVTATAIMSAVQEQGTQLLELPFWSILCPSGRFPIAPGAGVADVTLRQLLTMRSGLFPDGSLTLPGGVDAFLSTYLQQDAVAAPGSVERYSNTNFTILQVVYEVLNDGPPGSYADLVARNVLVPLGVDVAAGAMTAIPRPQTEALDYADREDTRPGRLWPRITCTGAGGWLGTAKGLLAFLGGFRANSLLSPATTAQMFGDRLGWYPGQSLFGTYYHHNGGLFTGRTPRQEIHTGIIHFPAGYDAVLFVNSAAAEPIRLMARAFTS